MYHFSAWVLMCATVLVHGMWWRGVGGFGCTVFWLMLWTIVCYGLMANPTLTRQNFSPKTRYHAKGSCTISRVCSVLLFVHLGYNLFLSGFPFLFAPTMWTMNIVFNMQVPEEWTGKSGEGCGEEIQLCTEQRGY